MNTFTKTLIAATLIGATAPAIAQDDDYCRRFARLAGSVMDARQSGADISEMLDHASEYAETNPRIVELNRVLVLTAFETPRFRTEKNQKRAISEFRNAMHLNCLKDNLE